MRFSAPRRPDPTLDVTPMIDVVFQLVLFFMVSTTFLEAPGLEVDLPRAAAEPLATSSEDLDIWIPCGRRLEGGGCLPGPLHLAAAPMDAATLQARLRQVGTERPDTLVILRADLGVPHGAVVEVIDAVQGAGLSRLAIATTPAEDPEE